MDATPFFRERVHSLLVRGLASTEVTRELGIKAVSEVWGAAEPLDRPAWYVWLREAPGAYRLGLEDSGRSDGGGELTGRFSIRYYPSRCEASFQAFSLEERTFVDRGFLDDTGTPRIERAHEIPDDLFAIGVLEYVTSAGGDRAEIALVSMDRLRVRYAEPAAFHYDPLGVSIEHGAGELARNVPAWELGVPLFRFLAGLHAHWAQRTPSQLAVEHHPGTEIVRTGGTFECLGADDVVVAEAVARFGEDCPTEPPPAPSVLGLASGLAIWSVARLPHAQRSTCSCCS